MLHGGVSLFVAAVVLVASGAGSAVPVSAAGTCAPAQHPRIAEVLYDAVGDDTGWEFVEFHNPFDRALPLAGARLEAGDGSGPGQIGRAHV